MSDIAEGAFSAAQICIIHNRGGRNPLHICGNRRGNNMKKLLVLLCAAGMSVPAFCATDAAKLDDRLSSARSVLEEIMSTPDKAIPDSIAKEAVCIGVVPGMVKGAFILGAEYGQG